MANRQVVSYPATSVEMRSTTQARRIGHVYVDHDTDVTHVHLSFTDYDEQAGVISGSASTIREMLVDMITAIDDIPSDDPAKITPPVSERYIREFGEHHGFGEVSEDRLRIATLEETLAFRWDDDADGFGKKAQCMRFALAVWERLLG